MIGGQMKVSGFSFIHNGIESGYPFVEAILAVRPYVDEIVVVDMQSTDGTRDILKKMDVRIIDGYWGNEAGKTLAEAHAMHVHCKGDIIWHAEADEVFEDRLCKAIKDALDRGLYNIAPNRLQLEQNFQRCRWYPEPVHRIFPNHYGVVKEGHTTNKHDLASSTPIDNGYLWDCTNIFRDNWFNRIKKQAELWNKEPQFIMTPIHVMHRIEYNEQEARLKLGESQWTMTETPFNIPKILRKHLGKTSYDPMLNIE